MGLAAARRRLSGPGLPWFLWTIGLVVLAVGWYGPQPGPMLFSVVILLEVPAAALLAWVWLRQAPPAAALPGLGLLLVGVATVVLGAARRPARAAAPELVGEPVETR